MIKDFIRELKTIDEKTWGEYAFKRDPLYARVSTDEKADMIVKANECGRREAIAIKEKQGIKTCREYANNLGITVSELEDLNSKDYILFAKFNSPNKISIYTHNIKKAEEVVKNENLNLLLEGVRIDDVLIAHEMFHFVEENNKEIYTRSTEIRLWKLGPIKYNSGLIALGEIAAMAFARELLDLSYSPNLFDILLLYPHDSSKSKMLYDEIHAMKGDENNV
jgi:hypothetical protein